MFQLKAEEYELLRFQIETSKIGRGGRRYMPYVFTEHGVTMLASVLNSDRAIQVNIAVVRAFVLLRETLETHKDLAKKLDHLERKFGDHDEKFKIVFEAIRKLMATRLPVTQKRIKGLGER
jgi:phage regulator Rha-like protein